MPKYYSTRNFVLVLNLLTWANTTLRISPIDPRRPAGPRSPIFLALSHATMVGVRRPTMGSSALQLLSSRHRILVSTSYDIVAN